MSHLLDLDEYTEDQLRNELKLRSVRRNAGRCDYCDRFKGDGVPCRFPRRHALARTVEEAPP